jgi:hypothetical protein
MPIDFNAKADEFIARVRTANITPSTDVVLIYHLNAINGSPLPPVRRSITGSTSVQGLATSEQRKAFARLAHLATILGNINSLVHHCPTTPFRMPETRDTLVTVQDIEMEIVESGP